MESFPRRIIDDSFLPADYQQKLQSLLEQINKRVKENDEKRKLAAAEKAKTAEAAEMTPSGESGTKKKEVTRARPSCPTSYRSQSDHDVDSDSDDEEAATAGDGNEACASLDQKADSNEESSDTMGEGSKRKFSSWGNYRYPYGNHYQIRSRYDWTEEEKQKLIAFADKWIPTDDSIVTKKMKPSSSSD
mmetsp:Transcript_22048/g.46180  ORF Transcript_22048/g.46180 Transcript_22048/m.46180 type:complete len:189 (-) Transcript_22048:95-661(-)